MLEGLLAPLRIVLQRSLADRLIVAATWLVIVCATTLLAIGVLYGDAVALSGLRQLIAAEPAAATSVDVTMRVDPADLAVVDETVSRQSRRILGWTDGELARTIRSGSFDLDPSIAGLSETDLAVFSAIGGAEAHARIADGAWPVGGRGPLEAALSSAAAAGLGLDVGDVVTLTARAGEERTLEVLIVGRWEPIDPAEAFWHGDGLELAGMSEGTSFTLRGPFVVAPEDLVDRVSAADVDVGWRILPEFDNLALENVRWMRSDTASLERRIRAELGDGAFFSVTTGLPDVLAGADRSLLVSRSGVLLLTFQVAVLAAYALVLVAGLLAEQRRIETALLRSRGASAGHVAWMATLEGALLVVPAALAAPWIALGALRLFDAVGPLSAAGINIEPRVDAVALVVALAAGLACIVGLVIPAFSSGRGPGTVRQTLARQGGRTFAQRLGIDLFLVVLAVIGLWQLRQYGAPLTEHVRGSLGLDPLLVSAPAIALLAGAILALRVVPLLARGGERLLGRRRGLVAPLGARMLARRPLRYTRSALLLMLAAALGTFAATYTTTWTGSQADQAAYQAGSDLRLEVASVPDLPPWAFGGAYRAVDGVDVAAPVLIDTFDVSGEMTGGQLVAIDASVLPEIASLRPDLLGGRTPAELAAALRPDLDGLALVPLPGEPHSLRVAIDTALENLPDVDADGNLLFAGPLPPSLAIGRVSVAVRDAGGLLHTFEAGGMQAAIVGQEIGIPLTEDLDAIGTITPAYPLELLGIQLLLAPPPDTRIAGEVEVTSVSTVDAAGVAAPLASALARDGWSWFIERGQLPPEPVARGSGRPGSMQIEEERPIFGDEGPVDLRLLPATLSEVADRPLPIVVNRTFAEETRSRVGDAVAIGSLTRRTAVEVVGVVDAFPTLDPAEPFAIIDLGGFALSTYVRNGEDLFVDEWWLEVSDEAAALAALGDEPYSAAAITSRGQRLRELSEDPVALGVVGALAIGSIAALLVALIGFVVSAVVSTRERLGEFALLRAMGLSPAQLSAWLIIENAFLLATGIVAGTALGLVLSWLVLPFVTLTTDARPAVPPVLVEIPWAAIGVVQLIAVAALVVAVAVIGSVLRRVPVSGVLRAGGE